MSQPGFTYERVQLVRVQLSLQIPDAADGCSQVALLESMKQSLLLNFNNLPYFQVYFHGLGTQPWSFDAKRDCGQCGVPITCKWLCNKIRKTIQPSFQTILSPSNYESFKTWFTSKGSTNREWMKITEDNEPFPGVPRSARCRSARSRQRAPQFHPRLCRRLFWSRHWSCFRLRRPVGGGSRGRD